MVYFALDGGFQAGAVEAEVETADAREKRGAIHLSIIAIANA